mgnify:FL=1
MKAHVVLLFLARSPAAIIFSVTGKVVYAVQRFAVWALSHVSQKIGKGFPLFANGNASASVQVERLIIRVCASLKHGVPRVVSRRRLFPCWAVPMFLRGLVSSVSANPGRNATARTSVSASQFGTCRAGQISAIAATNPSCSCTDMPISFNYDELPKFLPRQVNGELTFHWLIL